MRVYGKPAKIPADLHTHLLSKNLISTDYNDEINKLGTIGYHRLLIYMRPLQDSSKVFLQGTTFQHVFNLYDFDRKLRLLCIDAIEKIEVAVRSAVINTVAVSEGPHFYLYGKNFSSHNQYKEFLKKACDSRYLSVDHYYQNYDEPTLPPIWCVAEGITFGTLSRLVSNLNQNNIKMVSSCFKLKHHILVSWIRSLNLVRNMCAHHNRLWNKKMEVDKPKLANYIKDEFPTDTSSFFTRAVVINALMKIIDPGYKWNIKLAHLMREHSFVNPSAMGFLPNWDQRTFWQ